MSINNRRRAVKSSSDFWGLAVSLNVIRRALPRWSDGMTLALMTMPVIIAGRNTDQRPCRRRSFDAALGIGASPVQMVFHHVLPWRPPRHHDRHDHRHGPRHWAKPRRC